MLLENLSFPEVEDYLSNSDVILIPVGAVEQHSPYGLLGTDFIAAETIAHRLGENLGLLVAPTLTYGVSPHHMEFAGSATLTPSTFMQVIIDICMSFIHHGFRRIYIINGHGGNCNSIETAFQELKMAGVAGQLLSINWYDGLKEDERIKELFMGQDGSHATPSEISVTMAVRPDQFSQKEKVEKVVSAVEHYWPLTAQEMKTLFPDGRLHSASWLASVTKGQKVIDIAGEIVSQNIIKARKIPLI